MVSGFRVLDGDCGGLLEGLAEMLQGSALQRRTSTAITGPWCDLVAWLSFGVGAAQQPSAAGTIPYH